MCFNDASDAAVVMVFAKFRKCEIVEIFVAKVAVVHMHYI